MEARCTRVLPVPAAIGDHPRVTTLVVATSEGVSLRQDIAGAGSRLAAGLLDGIILGIGYAAVVVATLIPVAFDASGLSGFVLGALLGGAILAVLSYHVLFHALGSGQTPGKRALGIRVLSADGHPPSLLQILLRALLWPIDVFLTVPVPLGLILIAATDKHQRLGDLVAGTLLVRAPAADRRLEPFPGQTWSEMRMRTLPLTPGSAAHLTAQDREMLRDLLTRAELSDERRRTLYIAAAKHYSERLGLGRFADARIVLKELYLFARESAQEKGL